MKKKGTIIIGGHVQGLDLVRSLGKQGIPVWVIDTDFCIAAKSKYCSAYYRCPDYETKEFVDFLLNLGRKYHLSGWVLIPTNDFASHTLSLNRDKLLQTFLYTIPDKDIFYNFYKKKNTIFLAHKHGLPVPKTYFPMSWDDFNLDVQSAFIVRGIKGLIFYKTFGKKLFIANTRKELLQIRDTIKKSGHDLTNIMIQEKIPFDKKKRGFYFTSFTVEGEVKTFFMWEKLREHPLRHGTSTWCKSIYKEDLIETGKKLFQASGFTGVSEIEYLYDTRDGKYKIIEVNPRTFLQGSLARICGVDYGKIIYHYLQNGDFVWPQNYTTGKHWLHFWTDFLFGLKGIFKGEHSVKDFLAAYQMPDKEMAVFSLNDIKPFLWETILLPYILYKRSGKQKGESDVVFTNKECLDEYNVFDKSSCTDS